MAPSVSRPKPEVMTLSGGANPLATTVCISSCFCTAILRMDAVWSGLST